MTKTPYELAREDLGVWEWAEGDNPVIADYFKDAGHPEIKQDAVAWCAAFVGAMLARAGLEPSGELTARSYMNWGEPTDNPKEGDIAVFWRGKKAGWKGHVGFVVKIDGDKIHLLGGNQNDQVNIKVYSARQLLGYRSVPQVKSSPKPRWWLSFILGLFK